MSEQERIEHTDTVQDVAVKMSNGNPDALSVAVHLIHSGDILSLLDADDMNLRGENLWIAYKDHCGEDISLLSEKLRARDADMVATVNAQHSPDALLAQTHGGSRR